MFLALRNSKMWFILRLRLIWNILLLIYTEYIKYFSALNPRSMLKLLKRYIYELFYYCTISVVKICISDHIFEFLSAKNLYVDTKHDNICCNTKKAKTTPTDQRTEQPLSIWSILCLKWPTATIWAQIYPLYTHKGRKVGST
jgi:hypothetical protein